MSYSKENVQSIRINTTPSMLPTNLTISDSELAFVHDNYVHKISSEHIGDESRTASSTKLPSSPHRGAVSQTCFCPIGGKNILVVAMSQGAYFWLNSRLAHSFVIPASLTGASGRRAAFCAGIACNASAGLIYIGSSTGSVFEFSVVFGDGEAPVIKQQRVLAGGHEAPVVGIAAGTDGSGQQLLASCDEDGTLAIWNMAGAGHPSVLASIKSPTGAPAAGVSLQGSTLLVADVAGQVRVACAKRGKLLAKADAHCRCVTAVTSHPSEPLFATTSEDAVLLVWRVDPAADGSVKLSVAFRCEVSDHPLTGVQFHKDAAGDVHLVVNAFDVFSLRVFRGGKGASGPAGSGAAKGGAGGS